MVPESRNESEDTFLAFDGADLRLHIEPVERIRFEAFDFALCGLWDAARGIGDLYLHLSVPECV